MSHRRAQELRREEDTRRSCRADVTHALVVTDGGGQHGAHHAAAIEDVAVEEQVRVGDLALLVLRVDVAHQRTHALREVIGGADIHILHVHDVAGRAGEAQELRREEDVVDPAVLDVAHALVVTDGRG